jgi:hypothetical protein
MFRVLHGGGGDGGGGGGSGGGGRGGGSGGGCGGGDGGEDYDAAEAGAPADIEASLVGLRGDIDGARTYWTAALAMQRALHDAGAVADTLRQLAMACHRQGGPRIHGVAGWRQSDDDVDAAAADNDW